MVFTKNLRDLSASSLQIIFNQFFGLIIFFLLSRYLNKETFGELNWTLATLSMIVTFFSFGFDIIVLKRIVRGDDIKKISGVHLLHCLLSTIVIFLFIIIWKIIAPGIYYQYTLIPLVAFSILLTFLTAPFKQIANAKEYFQILAWMMVSNNLVKSFGLLIFYLFYDFDIHKVLYLFIFSSCIELILSIVLVYKKTKLKLLPAWNWETYKSLTKESLPQLGVVIFDSSLARIDWILLGILAGVTFTAEYSFTYKIFEISRLPLLIIAPIILPKFVRFFNNPDKLNEIKNDLQLLFKALLVISIIIPILFISQWTDLINLFTNNKYGGNTGNVYIILSLTIPFLYLNNLLWTIAFAQHQLKLTFYITVIISILNVLMNYLLIPQLNTIGAAISFLSCTIIQMIIYKVFVNQKAINIPVKPMIGTILFAIIAILISRYIVSGIISTSILSVVFYFALIFLFQVIKITDIRNLKRILTA